MKKLILTLILSINVFIPVVAQAPFSFKYQAVARNSSGKIVSDQDVGIRVSILLGSADGATMYVETFSTATNKYGLINLNIGQGTVVSGSMNAIDWSVGDYFIKIEMDINGGTAYTTYGTSQLLSVPFALHSKTAENVTGHLNELDPGFNASVASDITQPDITNWNNKLDTETDPLFNASVAGEITQTDTAYWNNKVSNETDPIFNSSVASSIIQPDITNWNNKVGTETDPLFNASVANGITQTDTAYWNNKVNNETDPLFNVSVAHGITQTDTTYWNNKVSNETDPLFNGSTAYGITETDTAYWNDKSEFDSNYNSLTNAPDIANTTDNKNIQLNTNDNTSSLSITKNNGATVFKVDGSGGMTGDGSGLSNVKAKVAYAQGNQNVYFHEGLISGLNLYEAQKMREVTINCPGPGIILAQATGYADWESIEQDLIRVWFYPHPTVNPTSSWETPDYHNLRIVSDYNCPDSSDQYTSWSHSKVYTVSNAQNFTVSICADKPFTSSKVVVGDVVLVLTYFPTGGTGPASTSSVILKSSSDIEPDNTTSSKIVASSIDGNTPIDTKTKTEATLEERVKYLEELVEKLLEAK